MEKEKFDRCVLIMNENISGGYLANAIAVIALTAGQRHPYLVGCNLTDKDGTQHPGLIPTGIPMLKAPNSILIELRGKALEKGYDVIGFPAQGQMTKNYGEFLDMMQSMHTDELKYLGIGIIGEKMA